MASPAIAITAQLLGSTAITNLVGTRIYPNVARIAEATYPMIVYKISGVSTTQTYGGSDGFTTCKVEVAALALNYADADTIAYALISQLDCTSGTWGGVTVQGCFLDEDGVSDDDAQETESEGYNYFIKTLTFTVIFNN